MTNFYNYNQPTDELTNENCFTQNQPSKSFLRSFCNDGSVGTRNVSTISGMPEFKETAQLGQKIHRKDNMNSLDMNSYS